MSWVDWKLRSEYEATILSVSIIMSNNSLDILFAELSGQIAGCCFDTGIRDP